MAPWLGQSWVVWKRWNGGGLSWKQSQRCQGFISTPTSTCMKREHQRTDRGKVGLLEVGTRGGKEGFGGQWQALNCAAANKNNLTGCLAEELRIMNGHAFFQTNLCHWFLLHRRATSGRNINLSWIWRGKSDKRITLSLGNSYAYGVALKQA